MYRCEKCKTIVPPNQKLNRVIVETRPKSYPIFRKAGGRRGFDGPPEPVRNAIGYEIAKEMSVCAPCAADLAEVEAAATAAPVAGETTAESITAAPVIVA